MQNPALWMKDIINDVVSVRLPGSRLYYSMSSKAYYQVERANVSPASSSNQSGQPILIVVTSEVMRRLSRSPDDPPLLERVEEKIRSVVNTYLDDYDSETTTKSEVFRIEINGQVML